MFTMYGKKILLKKVENSSTTTAGSIIVVNLNTEESNTLLAEVIGIGPEVKEFAIGDKVYFHKFDAKQFTHDRNVYWVVAEEHVLTKVNSK